MTLARSTRHGSALALAAACLALGAGSARAACDTSICSGGAAACSISGVHQIDNLCTLDFGAKTVTVLKGARLENDSGGVFTILADDLIVQGELEALDGGVFVDVVDEFKTEIVSNSAGRMDFREGGFIDVSAGGDCTVGGKDFDTSGTGGTDGGDIDIFCGGCVHVNKTIDASGGGDFAFGGWITIDAGDCITTSALIKSIGTQEGDGGDLDLDAVNDITLNGKLNSSASGEFAFGGFVTIDADNCTLNGDINTNGGSEGVGGDIDIFCSGTLTTGTTSQMTLTAGGGGCGGFATLDGGGNVTLNGDIDAGAGGGDADGGDIDVTSTGADLTVASTSVLTVDTGSGGFGDGDISLFGCDVEVDGVLDSRGGPQDGSNTVIYRETFDGTSATMRAGNSGGNTLVCRCVDTSPADGMCDTPLACVNDPMTSGGTYNPSPTTSHRILAACN